MANGVVPDEIDVGGGLPGDNAVDDIVPQPAAAAGWIHGLVDPVQADGDDVQVRDPGPALVVPDDLQGLLRLYNAQERTARPAQTYRGVKSVRETCLLCGDLQDVGVVRERRTQRRRASSQTVPLPTSSLTRLTTTTEVMRAAEQTLWRLSTSAPTLSMP